MFSLKSTSSNHIRIYENGTLELVKALNYEIESSFSISLEIAGPLRSNAKKLMHSFIFVLSPNSAATNANYRSNGC